MYCEHCGGILIASFMLERNEKTGKMEEVVDYVSCLDCLRNTPVPLMTKGEWLRMLAQENNKGLIKG